MDIVLGSVEQITEQAEYCEIKILLNRLWIPLSVRKGE